jgi:hypothetical protein
VSRVRVARDRDGIPRIVRVYDEPPTALRGLRAPSSVVVRVALLPAREVPWLRTLMEATP